MRGAAPQILSPYPMSTLLPAVLQEDPLIGALTAGLDEVLAAAIATLDCLDAYLDPALAPADFVDWLAGWVGLRLPAGCSTQRRRVTVASAVRLYRGLGTPAGLRDFVEVVTGVPVEVLDSGGVGYSTTPGGAPGTAAADDPTPHPGPWLRVLVPAGTDQGTIDAVEAVVAAVGPAHVPHTVAANERATRR